MKRFIEGEDRSQATLRPTYLDDYDAEDNPVRAVVAFVELKLFSQAMVAIDSSKTSRSPKPTRTRAR